MCMWLSVVPRSAHRVPWSSGPSQSLHPRHRPLIPTASEKLLVETILVSKEEFWVMAPWVTLIFNFKMKTAYSRKLNELQRLTSSSGEGQSEGLIGGEALCVQMESHMMESVWERGKRGGERASKYGCLKGIYFTRLRYYRSLQRNCGWPHFIHNLIFF